MAKLAENRYGKSRVRLVKVTRGKSAHSVKDWNLNISFEGDYGSCFESGDNSRILPTDTMKNTVYSLARDSSADCIEEFAIELVEYFLKNNPAASRVSVAIVEKWWEHIAVDGESYPTAFEQRDSCEQTTVASRAREGDISVISGLQRLVILKTANSAFEGYIKDRLTTLRESSDRLFGTEVTAKWSYSAVAALEGPQFGPLREQIVQTLLSTFAEHKSLSVQHTLFAMGEAVLAAVDSVSDITLTMPNRHCLMLNLEPFGQDNPNEIFVPTDEPHGSIEARIVR